MKKNNIILLIFTALVVSSCEKDSVEIDTLQIFGDEFYQGQAVNMGMSVKTSDPDKNYYEWWCEAGSFPDRQQGYPVMKWTAPRENGEYLIRCTVTCGNAKETREAKVKVNGIFFDRITGNTTSGWTVTNQAAAVKGGRIETHVNGSRPADSIGSITRTLSLTDFYPPLSATADVGIDGSAFNTYNPKYPVAQKNPGWDNLMSVGVTGNAPSAELAPTHYISGIRAEWWPMEHMAKEPLIYLDPVSGEEKTIDPTTYDARVVVVVTQRADPGAGIVSSDAAYSVFFNSGAFKAGLDQTRNVGISVDENYVIRVAVDKNEVFSTNAFQGMRAANGNAPLRLDLFRFAYPNNTQVYLDNLVLNNTTEFLY